MSITLYCLFSVQCSHRIKQGDTLKIKSCKVCSNVIIQFAQYCYCLITVLPFCRTEVGQRWGIKSARLWQPGAIIPAKRLYFLFQEHEASLPVGDITAEGSTQKTTETQRDHADLCLLTCSPLEGCHPHPTPSVPCCLPSLRAILTFLPALSNCLFSGPMRPSLLHHNYKLAAPSSTSHSAQRRDPRRAHISDLEESSPRCSLPSLTFLLFLLLPSQNDIVSFRFTLFKCLHKYLWRVRR